MNKPQVMIIRHFKTEKDERINYNKSQEYIKYFIKIIKSYILDNKTKKIKIYTSDCDRTIITSLLIYIKLKDELNISILSPNTDIMLNRDPNKKKYPEIKKYFNDYVFNENELIIFFTHSSIYTHLLNSILENKIDNFKHICNKKRVHSFSISHIGYKKNINYKFNINPMK